MARQRVEITDSWETTWTASTGEEWIRLVMALASSNCTLPSLLVVVADSQGVQAAAAYSSMLRITATQTRRRFEVCHPQVVPPELGGG